MTSPEVRSTQKPPNFSWLQPGVLSASAFPDKIDYLNYLVDENVRCLVTLTAERSVDKGSIPDDELRIVRLPIRDYTPPTIEQVESFIKTVQETKAEGKATCVHCAHGLGRTGTMLACYFVSTDSMTPEEAIAHVRQLRPGSLETSEQELLVHEFYGNKLQKSGK